LRADNIKLLKKVGYFRSYGRKKMEPGISLNSI
jgi:hypothetical protein